MKLGYLRFQFSNDQTFIQCLSSCIKCLVVIYAPLALFIRELKKLMQLFIGLLMQLL